MGTELKQQFLDKLKAFKKAMDYMDGPASIEDKIKWEPRIVQMRKELNDLEYQLRQSGCEMSDEEIHRLIENL
jgi:hypothetical protein